MRNGMVKLLLLLGVGLAALAGWVVTRPQPVTVAVRPAEVGVVQRTVANTRAGTVKACRRAGVSPSQGGQVAKLAVVEGERVVPGQLLLEIWNDDRRAQLLLAEREAEAAAARAEEACLRAEVLEREAQRLRTLQAKGYVTEERLDRANTDALASQAACRAVRATVGEAAARVKVTAAQLELTILKAPFAGVVAEVNAEVGQTVTPSPPGIPTPPAIDLIDDGCLLVSAPMDEVDAPAIRVGMSVCIALDAFAGRRCGSKVTRVAPYVMDWEKQARTVEVEVRLEHPEELRGLLPGYSADVEVILEERSQVLRIPSEALMEGKRVLVLGEDGLLHERGVRTGLTNWAFTEVSEGLARGERVVTSLDRKGVKAEVKAVAEGAKGGE